MARDLTNLLKELSVTKEDLMPKDTQNIPFLELAKRELNKIQDSAKNLAEIIETMNISKEDLLRKDKATSLKEWLDDERAKELRQKEQEEIASKIVNQLIEPAATNGRKPGDLSSLVNQLDDETLNKKTFNGNSLRMLICEMTPEDIDPKRIKEEHLNEKNKDGETLAHILAYHGLLGKVGKKNLSAYLMEARDKDGNTPLHTAYLAGMGHKLPKEYEVPTCTQSKEGNIQTEVKIHKLDTIPAYFMPNNQNQTPSDLHRKSIEEAKKREDSELSMA